MDFNSVNFVLAFIEGVGLIISPCILPILPIILSGSIEGGRRRPLGIIVGFTGVFALFTLFSHFLVARLGINLNVLRDIAFVSIALFGVIMVSSYLTEKFSSSTQKIANVGNQLTIAAKNHGGFHSGLLLGGLVSLIWTPCAGPLLAAVLVQIAVQKTALASFIALACFALGSVVPMILIAILGKRLLRPMRFFRKHTDSLRKILGIIMIASAVFLAYASYVNPSLLAFTSATPISATTNAADAAVDQNTPSNADKLIDELSAPYPAPALENSTAWINSKPLSLQQLKGKVVLIDFWTYSCINCIRTLPYLIAWDKAYRDKGLVIIGVHTPEFEFEKDMANVQQAVQRDGIQYPVLLDSQYVTWQNFNNQYWPAHYLIDKNGQVVYQHFGEGEYDVTEHNIRALLGVHDMPMAQTQSQHPENTLVSMKTPETYFGYNRADRFANTGATVKDSAATYRFPDQLAPDEWALRGQWLINAEDITAMAPDNAIKLHFSAQHVYVVAGSKDAKPIKIRVLFNNIDVTTANAGSDVHDGMLMITNQRLYDVLSFPKSVEGELTLVIESPEVSFYTFTFG